MKKIILQVIFVLIGISPSFCQQNSWTQKAAFFEAREGAASFVINNKLYVGTGDDKADLWEYDPATNTWTQKAGLPAAGRSYAVGFSIGNKGYIATGSRKIPLTPTAIIDGLMKDVWEYDPASDSWTKKADFGGVARARAVGFVLNNKAYLGTGESVGSIYFLTDFPVRVTSDFWSFDPVADKWTRIADFPGYRMNAIAFSGNGKGFVGTGFYNTHTAFSKEIKFPGDNLQDLWAYDTASNSWVRKSNFPGGKRMGMSVFSIGDTTYTIAGAAVADKYWPSTADTLKKDDWAYNTATDTWVQKSDFPGGARRYTIAGAIADKAYAGSGGTNDLWEYGPALSLLPVTLVSFTGIVQNNKAKLEWMVENEQSLDHYEVYKSRDGTAFQKSGEAKATNDKKYTYEDDLPATVQKSYYRLRIVDRDGSALYSRIISVLNGAEGIRVAGFYPSPLTGNTGYLNFTSGRAQQVQVAVTDITGHILQTWTFPVMQGANTVPLTFGNLDVGVHLLKILDEKNASHTIRFIKK